MKAAREIREIQDGLKGSLPLERVREVVRAVHVVPAPTDQPGWMVKKAGVRRIDRHFETQSEALRFARRIVENQASKIILHGQDGFVTEEELTDRESRRSMR